MTRLNARPDRKSRSLDEYLVVAVQAGDYQALDQLIRIWHPRLLVHAWRLIGRRDAADDVVQAAWVEIMRGVSALRDERAFAAWAYRIVTRQVAKRIGRIVAERTAIDAAATELETREDVTNVGSAVDATRLRAAIATLSPAHRATVALHYFNGLSVAEVAVALDVPSGTVKTRLMHARQQLRAQFKGDEHD